MKTPTETKGNLRKAEDESEGIDMKKVLGIVMVLMMVIGLMVPAFAGEANEKKAVALDCMWVNCADGKTLNVRQEPTTKSKVLYRVECGTKLNILEESGKDWVHVFADGKDIGYVMKKFLVEEKPGKYEITERAGNFKAVEPYEVTALARGKNTEESVGLRVKPNKTSKMFRRLMAGDTLTVIEVAKTWSKVMDPETGETGYVANDYIAKV